MKTYDVDSFGALADGLTLATQAIQRAIDACNEDGGGQVVIGPGEYLSGSIEIKTGVELYLSSGCRLVGSKSISDYEDLVADGFIGERAPEQSAKCLIRAVKASNIGITGPGEIIGSGLAFYDQEDMTGKFFRKPDNERPRLVMMYECRDVRFESTAYIDSPCWTLWIMKCERVSIRGVRVHGDQRMINNDGIDIDSCSDVTISDCTIKTGDDCLVLRAIDGVFSEAKPCEKVTISNCVLDSWCQGIRVGCPADGTIRNAVFSNIVIHSGNNGILLEHPKRYLLPGSTGSADIHDIRFYGMVIQSDGSPIRVNVEEGIALKRISDLSFSDMQIRSILPCRIEGSSNTVIRNVGFSNMRIVTSGNDAVVFRSCEGIRLDNVELANHPIE